MVVVFALGASRLGLIGTMAVLVAAQVAGTVGAAVRLSRVMRLRRADLAPFAPLGRIAAAAAAAGVVAAITRFAILPASPFIVVAAGAAMYGFAYVMAIAAARVLGADEWMSLRAIFGRWGITGSPERELLRG